MLVSTDINEVVSQSVALAGQTDNPQAVSLAQVFADQAQIPDEAGLWPGSEGYVPTYDIAYVTLGILASSPTITRLSSENTAVTLSSNISALADWLLEQSTIASYSGSYRSPLQFSWVDAPSNSPIPARIIGYYGPDSG